jgi:hypothetical protein
VLEKGVAILCVVVEMQVGIHDARWGLHDSPIRELAGFAE